MAYTQSPANILKGQMTNKAVGLAHGDSMAMQTDPKDGTILTGSKTSTKKDELKDLLDLQKQYDQNIKSSVRNLAEQDSLRLMSGSKSDQKKAKRIYGSKYTSDKKIPFYPNASQYQEQLENRDKLKKKAQEISGPRPSLNN
tara:strand:+ start:796 stop:1221 length:426 start_codon:yes stop_codon:yes gene_type:complete